MSNSTLNTWWQQRRYDVAAIGSIILFFIAFFPHVLFGNSYIIAGDAYYQSYPLRTVAWDAIRSGHLPMWTPVILSGYPLMSMAQVAIGYPLTWSYLFLPGLWAEQLYVLAPYLLTPIFTYFYVREIGRSRLAALLTGLAFGYGGMMCSFISNSGILTNTLMWTPLVLLFVDRAQRRRITHCLPFAAVAYSLSVLAGHAQSYVYAGILIAAYGCFLSLFGKQRTQAGPGERWRPLFVSIAAIMLGAGVAAFQLFESSRAARRSIRNEITYERFSEGSFPLLKAVLSLGAPLYHYIDTSPFLTPIAFLFAAGALVLYSRRQDRSDARIWFWALVAVVSFLMLLGSSTPLNRVIYLIPILKLFRVPSRHTFEFTLSVSILAAFGWDWISSIIKSRNQKSSIGRDIIVPLVLVAATVVIGVFWWNAANKPPAPHPYIFTGLPENTYWLWKCAFTVVILLLLGWCLFISQSTRMRTTFLGLTILIACFAEPAATVSSWWGRRLSLSSERLQLVSPTTRYLQQFPATGNRVYTRTELFAEEFHHDPRLEASNLHAVYGLQNVAGYEPLILERYSRALGNVGPDSVTPLPGYPGNDDIFSARSHVLDLLNTTHVVSFESLKTFLYQLIYKDGVGVAGGDLEAVMRPGEAVKFPGSSAPSNQLVLVTSLSNSVEIKQGATVARARITFADGNIKELDIRAGVETAEWAHERADVKAAIKHELAPVYDSRPGDPSNSFPASRFWARMDLGTEQIVKNVDIVNVSETAHFVLWSATLYNATTSQSSILLRESGSEFWQTVYAKDRVEIRHNTRALPRAWLVGEARAVDGETALREIRGEANPDFDPRRTALLEVSASELPALPGGSIDSTSSVKITNYEPNRIRYETNSPSATILVTSEIFYPGWVAEVDGRPERILLTDFLLRGVYLPPGSHTVEMRYTATAARNGSFITLISLGVIGALFLIGRRKS